MLKRIKSHYLLIILIIILAACQAPPPSPPEPVVETMVVTEVLQSTPVEVIKVVTPTSEPAGPHTLVVCNHFEPESLRFIYGVDIQNSIQQAIFDGPIDDNSFAYKAVILEKLPNLADGDAILTKVTVNEGDTIVDAYTNLVTLDPAAEPPIMLIPAGRGDPVPYVGGEFEMEQLSVTFKLLPDLLWSDGAPLTAADSVFAFNLMSDPAFGGLQDWIVTRTVAYRQQNDLTILWIGVPGYLDSTYQTVFFGPFPEHIMNQYSPAELVEAEELSRAPVGWGPYIIDEWVPGESITLRKNTFYFRADEGLPKFDYVIYRFTSDDPNTNIAALLSGECDIVTIPLQVQMDLLLELHETGKIKTSFTTGTVWEHIDFGIQHIDYDDGYQLVVDRPDFFSDVRTRKAFAMCMDRQALVDTIFSGQSIVPDSYVPPQHPLYNPEVRQYDFNVAAGSALLEEVGWLDEDDDPNTPRVARNVINVRDGTPLELDYETTSGSIRQQATAMIKDSLAQCGIKTNIHLYDPSEYFADGPEGKLLGRRFDLGQFSWIGGPEAQCNWYLSSSVTGPKDKNWISIQDGLERTFRNGWDDWNQIGFTNDEFDLACQTAMRSLPGEPEHKAAHLDSQRIFSEQLPSVPLFLYIKVTATRPDMCGVIMDPSTFSEFWNIEEFDYGENCEE